MRPLRTPYGEIRNEIAERARREAERADHVDNRSPAAQRADLTMEIVSVGAVLAVIAGALWKVANL